MSIASEIQRIRSNVASAYSACAAKGATMPAEQNTANLPATIVSIPSFVRVEYLESTGTQYVDTGIRTGPGTRSETDVAVLDWDASAYALSGAGSNRHVFGKGYSGASSGSGNAAKLYFGLGAQNYPSSVALSGLAGVRHVYWIDAPSATAGIDGTSFSLGSAGTIGTNDFTSLLLAQRQSATGTRGQMAARLYGCRYYEAGELVLDLVPVRVGPLGLLYDRVSGDVFPNAGTGAFILGPNLTAT